MNDKKNRIYLISTFLLVLLILLIVPTVFAAEGHAPLLALITKDNVQEGMIAGLDLKIIEGEEKVFLQTFPMTQVSTQVSMRFAQQIACNEYDIDCSEKDFLYTITAVPGIIGGPSAGALASVLTIALLMDKQFDETIALTGTINSGGLIGPVGGLPKKIEAAAKNGIKIVLIPLGTAQYNVDENVSMNLIELGEKLNITVKEVATLEEAVEIIVGIPQKKKSAILTIDEKYVEKMKTISEDLCSRSEKLEKEVLVGVEEDYDKKAKEALEKEDYYSAASYCFRQNVALQKKIFEEKNIQEIDEILSDLDSLITKQEEELEKHKIRTLTDIETYMAVMERIEEANELAQESKAASEKNKADLAALATERLYSASAWSEFFDLTYDTRILIDGEKIKKACASKISEADERYNYVKLLFKEDSLVSIKNVLTDAYNSMNDNDNIMCLYKASKAKAESDLFIAWKGVSLDNFQKIMDVKLTAARDAIAKALSKGAFPIIAYSYYEYSQNLLKSEEMISALFAEYALELSTIDLYFREPGVSAISVIKGEELDKERQKQEYLWKLTVTGFLILAIILAIVIYELGSKKRDKKIKEMLKQYRKKQRQKKKRIKKK